MRRKNNSEGFTLITTLMLLFLLSGLAIGMLMMVNTEVKVGTQDVQNNQTFHAAEGAIEKMTSDLATEFQGTLSPTIADIQGLSSLAPVGTYQQSYGLPGWPGVTLPVYTLTPVTNAAGTAIAINTGAVSSGPYAGLNAETMQVNLQATAQGPLGDEVSMARTVEVALIPVFQFGVFSDGDLAFFTNPTLTFNGRIHTNGDLYLGCAGGNTCTFTDKITAYGNIVRAVIPNGTSAATANDQGSVKVPGTSGGCGTPANPTNQPACTTLPVTGDLWGSVLGAGGDPAASGYNNGNPNWVTLSEGTWTTANKYLGGMMIDGNYGTTPNTGATNLTLPFVQGATASTIPGLGIGPQNYEIVRQPPAGESATSPLGASRMYNEAAIRVLLADKPEYLPGGASDPDNVRLANIASAQPGNTVNYSTGVPTLQPNLTALAAGQNYTTYFATASTAVPNQSTSATTTAICGTGINLCYYADWLYAPAISPVTTEFDSVDGNVPRSATAIGANGVTQAPPTQQVIQAYPYYSEPTLNSNAAGDTQWNLIDGYLRVEFLPTSGSCPGPGTQVNGYCAVTREWLQFGFARSSTPPTTPGFPWTAAATQNPVNPYAILLLQQPAMRNVTGWPTPPALDMTGTTPSGCSGGLKCTSGKPPEVPYDNYLFTQNATWKNPYHSACTATMSSFTCTAFTTPSRTAFNWYPINFYDSREGEPNDTVQGNMSCTPLGVMNAVELDVGNLQQWLLGNIPGSGSLVNSTNQNGFVLYFSDRRGMLANPNGTQTIAAGNISGDAGFEDVVNGSSGTRAPDGTLEPAPAGKNISPEDANLTGTLENFGSKNLGLGLGYVPAPSTTPGSAYTSGNGVNAKINAGAVPNPYLTSARMSSCTVAQDGWVSGARHVLKLVDGGMSNAGVTYLPHVNVAYPGWGGFTVGSENPVYIFGNYNTFATDTVWNTPPVDMKPSAAGIVADTVTLLSNNWLDWSTILLQPTQPQTCGGTGCNGAGNREAATTYYRTAIATGDVQAFPYPGWANDGFIGTDGGVGNFLRLLEDWNNGSVLNYRGSMVNLFFSTYNTGLFKCCNYAIYTPPTRNYFFDTDFNTMSNLPPGTPTFRDIDNLSYRQNLTACTVQANGLCSN